MPEPFNYYVLLHDFIFNYTSLDRKNRFKQSLELAFLDSIMINWKM